MDAATFATFVQVVLIDLVLAGDNAVVIGMAAASLAARQRGRAILLGVIAATLLRVLFALLATQLLSVAGLPLAGGLLLLWVCWKMWLELRSSVGAGNTKDEHTSLRGPAVRGKTLREAVIQIVIADASMSLDNVLAVAGAAQRHVLPLVLGLALSVALMGLASAFLAALLHRHPWISYLGLAVILFVAGRMTFEGARAILQ